MMDLKHSRIVRYKEPVIFFGAISISILAVGIYLGVKFATPKQIDRKVIHQFALDLEAKCNERIPNAKSRKESLKLHWQKYAECSSWSQWAEKRLKEVI